LIDTLGFINMLADELDPDNVPPEESLFEWSQLYEMELKELVQLKFNQKVPDRALRSFNNYMVSPTRKCHVKCISPSLQSILLKISNIFYS
jgi:hypothetical protein